MSKMFRLTGCSLNSLFQQQVLHSVSNLHLLLTTLQVKNDFQALNTYLAVQNSKDTTI